MPFKSQGGNIKDDFVTEEELIEKFTGKQLWLWGRGVCGALGNNSTANQSSPVQTISGGTNWRSVSLGFDHSTAIKTDGSLWTWGEAGSGQLGNNSTTDRTSPVQTISGGNNWRSVSGGRAHTAAIKTDGTLWLWGCGAFGQLGNNAATNQSSPVQTISGGTNWRNATTTPFSTAAIKTDGSLWTWGIANFGQLGDNEIANRSSPVQTISGGTNWRSFSGGRDFMSAIKTDGSLWSWGLATDGQLGNGAISNRSSPVQTISGGTNWRSVSGNYRHVAAIKTDGTLWLWGCGGEGQLGNNATTSRSSPIQTISGGTNWRSVSGNGLHTASIKTDGTLWLWGRNFFGQLGNNATNNISSPIQTISGGTNWRNLALGTYHTAATRLEEF